MTEFISSLTQLGLGGVSVGILAYLLYGFRKDTMRQQMRDEERQDKYLRMMEMFLERIHSNNMLLAAFGEDIKVSTQVSREIATLLHEHSAESKAAIAKVGEMHRKMKK